MAHNSSSTMAYRTTSSDSCNDFASIYVAFQTDSDCHQPKKSQPAVVPGNCCRLSADSQSNDLCPYRLTEEAEVSQTKALAMPQLSASDAAAAAPNISDEPTALPGRAFRNKPSKKTKQLKQPLKQTNKKIKNLTPKKRQNRKQKEGPRPIDKLRRMCYGIRSLLCQWPMWRELFKKHPKCRNGVCEKCCYTFLLQMLGNPSMLPTDVEIEGNRVVEYLARVMSCKAGHVIEPRALAGGFVQGTAARPGQSYTINKADVERLCGIKPWEWDVPLFSAGQAE